jgi:hypothetical protein
MTAKLHNRILAIHNQGARRLQLRVVVVTLASAQVGCNEINCAGAPQSAPAAGQGGARAPAGQGGARAPAGQSGVPSVFEANEPGATSAGKPISAAKLRRQAPPQEFAQEEEANLGDTTVVKPPTPAVEIKEEAYGKKVLGTKKNFGILSRRERILNVRYMTDTIKETSKNQNTLLESKVRSLFIQHLREEDAQ